MAPFILSIVAFVGLIAVALSMSFIDDAPGDIGSPIARLFHAVGAIQLVLGLGVLVSAMFLVIRGSDVKLWGNLILVLGSISIAGQLLMVVEGAFAVIFLAIPGLLAVVGGLLVRRKRVRDEAQVNLPKRNPMKNAKIAAIAVPATIDAASTPLKG